MDRKSIEFMVSTDDKYKMFCPRCGNMLGKYPAVSRYADVDICDDCGTEEAMMSFNGKTNNFNDWKVGQK